MALTLNSKEYTTFGNKAVAIADVAFDSSYPFGGEAFNPDQMVGIHDIDLALIESQKGYSFSYDTANQKVKVFAPAPPVVYDEHHTISAAGAITLKYPAAFIVNVATPGQNLKLRSTGIAFATLGSNECCLASQMAEGELTTLTCKMASDELSGDGAFTGGTTNWTFAAAPWTYGTNSLEKDANGTDALSHDNFAAVVGRKYRLSVTLTKQGAESDVVGTITPTLGGTAGAASTEAEGTYTWDIVATTTGGLSIAPSNAARFVIDSVTVYCMEAYVTYVTQAWRDVWDNLVQDEALTLATGANTLDSGNKILACMYVDQTTATAAALTMVDEDDTAASGEIDIKFNAATAQLTANAAQNAKAVKITYIKRPTSGFLHDRAFVNESATNSGGDPYLNTFDYPIVLWGYSGCAPVNTGTTQVLIDYAGTPAAGEGVVDYFAPGARGAGAPAAGTVIGVKSNVTLTGAGVWGTVNEIQTQPLEVTEGADLSGLSSVKMILIGT